MQSIVDNGDAIMEPMNAMVLRSGAVVPDPESPSQPKPPLARESSFDMLPELTNSTDNELERSKRQLAPVLALSAVEAAEFLAQAVADVAALPIEHAAITAETAAAAIPEAAPATGLYHAGELAAAVVPAALPSLVVPPILIGQPGDEAPSPTPPDSHPDDGGSPLDGDDQLTHHQPGAPPKKKAKSSDAAPKYIKFGDNSVHTTEVSEAPIYGLTPLGDSTPNFIAHGLPLVRNHPQSFVVGGNQLTFRSSVVPLLTQGSCAPGVNCDALVFDYHAIPLVMADTTACTIKFADPVMKSALALSDLSPFMHGNSVSAKYVADMLRPYLIPANTNLLYNMADYLRNQLIFFDNRAMYAKLVCQALALDIAVKIGTQTTAEAWPAANHVHFINLDDANLTATSIHDVLNGDTIVFTQNRDWFADDLLVTHWLAAPGFRVDGADGHPTSYAGYINWPAIPVTVLYHGQAPARPAEALLTSQAILAFAQRIASRRNELDAFTQGIYIAMELVGLRYELLNNHAYYLSSNFNVGPISLPKPSDYNFMLRAAALLPNMAEQLISESTHFVSASANDRALVTAFYNALISAFSTTLLHSLSISVENLISWGTNADPTSFVSSILNYGICRPLKAVKSEVVMYGMPKAAIKHYLGLVPLSGTFESSNWCGYPGEVPTVANHFNGMTNENAPRFGSLLSIDNFLLQRPQEWAILGPRTRVDLAKELNVDTGRPNARGVRTYLGASTYSERARSKTPYLFVPYGNQVVNAIHQSLTMNVPNVSYNHKVWNAGEAEEWEVPAQYVNAAFIAALHCFEPCVLASYNYVNKEVRAPCMINNALTPNQRRMLTNFKGQEIDNVGYVLEMLPNDRFTSADPPPIEAFAALSMFGAPSEAAAQPGTSASGSSGALN